MVQAAAAHTTTAPGAQTPECLRHLCILGPSPARKPCALCSPGGTLCTALPWLSLALRLWPSCAPSGHAGQQVGERSALPSAPQQRLESFSGAGAQPAGGQGRAGDEGVNPEWEEQLARQCDWIQLSLAGNSANLFSSPGQHASRLVALCSCVLRFRV